MVGCPPDTAVPGVWLLEGLEREYPTAGKSWEGTLQDLLGHKEVSKTMIDTHVLSRPGLAVRSPLDVA